VPVIGLVQVGSQFIADRYTYLPLIGLLVAVVWGVGNLAMRWPREPAVAWACGAAVLFLTAVAAWNQAGYWRDSTTLLTRLLEVEPDSLFGHMKLGLVRAREGDIDEVERHFSTAIQLRADNQEARINLQLVEMRQGEVDIHTVRRHRGGAAA